MGFTVVLLSVNRDIQKIRKNNEPGALERRHENSINMASSFPLVPLTMWWGKKIWVNGLVSWVNGFPKIKRGDVLAIGWED